MAAEVAAGAGVATAVIQSKVVWDQLKEKITLSNDMDEIYTALKDAVARLQAKRDDHQQSVQKYRTTKTPYNTYDNWIHRVRTVEGEVEKLGRIYIMKSKKSKIFSLFERSNFSKKMKKKALEVIDYLKEGYRMGGDILRDKEPSRVVKMTTPDIKDIPTLQGPLKEILCCLSDTKVVGVRIHGLVGSGKTVIMQNLNNHEKVAKMFDIVIWVKVSTEESKENSGIQHLQKVIAERLGLDVEDNIRVDKLAIRIREELENMKYLLLLDDVKQELDFDLIGIPTSGSGSKIVFTTRLRHVCSSIATKQINVRRLNQSEALSMFKNVLQRPELVENPNFNRLMPQIVDLCGHHPLMIKVVAGTFKKKESEQSWHDGIKNLRKWPEKGDDSMQQIYKLLKCCFDDLRDTLKTCFFYSALYPEESDIHKVNLLDNWAAEGLLGHNDDVEDLRVNGREILDHLKTVLLLEETMCTRYIRMHKLIQLAAQYSLSTYGNLRNLMKSGEALQRPPDANEWMQKSWISLVDSKLNALPDQPDCSTLSTLFLQKNPKLKVIPRAFFNHMGELRVLDLYGAGISSLPVSFSELVSLKGLYLQCCANLVKLPSEIEKLQQLLVLDIRGSGLLNVPPEVRSLKLRRLLVSFILSGKTNGIQNIMIGYQNIMIGCQVISEISTLEELVIDTEEDFGCLLSAVINNLKELTRLSLLEFCLQGRVVDVIEVVGDIRKVYFPTDYHLKIYADKNNTIDFGLYKRKNITDFTVWQVFTGRDFSSLPQIPEFSKYDRFVKYCDGEVCDDAISKLLCNADALELVNHKELEHLSTFKTGSMDNVRGCFIESCNKIRTVVDGNCEGSPILPNLEHLHMVNLPNLKSIWEGSTQSLSKLQTLVLSDCPMLTIICSYDVIQQLAEIQHLELKCCSGIQEIVEGSLNPGSPILPKLKALTLDSMPQLRCICRNDFLKWPSLESLKIHGCPELKRLPFKEDGAEKLTSIEVERNWWEALENSNEVKEKFKAIAIFRSQMSMSA